jgi:hypothetical protein
MGLRQHIEAGAKLSRVVTTITTDPSGTGAVLLGDALALLSIQASTSCRVRLYDNEDSLLDAGEIARPYGNLSISSSVGLIGDFTMSANQRNFIDPVLYAIPSTKGSPIYYRTDPATSTGLSLTHYLLDDNAVQPSAGTAYAIDNRRTLTIEEELPSTDDVVTGILSTGPVSKTYLLVSASLGDPEHVARVRLYRVSASLDNGTEQDRVFSEEPPAQVQLIVDMILSGSAPIYFVPKILGANLDNMGTDLNSIKNTRSQFVGKSELYYSVQNLTSVADTHTVGLHIFSLED